MPVLSRPLHAGRRGGPGKTRRRRRRPAPRSWGGPRAGPGPVPGSASRPRPAPASPRPASHPSPTGPALRAIPCPEVTEPVCRLPLPTLFYRQRLFTLETAADMGTARHENHTAYPGFSRPAGRTRHRKSRGALREQRPYLRSNRFGASALTKKRTLPGAPASVSWCVCAAALGPGGPVSVSGFGNINPIPSAASGIIVAPKQTLRFGTGFPYALGPTDPCSTAVHMEPFSTSAFKVLV